MFYTLGTPTDTGAGASAEVLINATPVPNSRSASTVSGPTSPNSPVTVFQSNVSLIAGQQVAVGLAVTNRTGVALINNKIKIKKLV
jgi:hypothetical protein